MPKTLFVTGKLAEPALRTTLERMAPDFPYEVVVLRIWAGMTLSDLAEVTGRAISSVHGQYQSALSAIRHKLESPCKT